MSCCPVKNLPFLRIKLLLASVRAGVVHLLRDGAAVGGDSEESLAVVVALVMMERGGVRERAHTMCEQGE